MSSGYVEFEILVLARLLKVLLSLRLNKAFLLTHWTRTHSTISTGGWYWSVAYPDLQIRGGGGQGGHPDPEIRGEGGGLKKIFFRPFGPQFCLKIGGPGPWAPPLHPPLVKKVTTDFFG